MSSKTQVIDNNNPWVQQYTYDQLNRIKTSTTQGNNQFATSYSYDANGNILNLTRKDYKGDALDNLTYNYENKSAGYQRNTNRLRSVDDAVGATNQKDDIEDQQEDNYRYDATGNLIYDRSEEIESIQWTVSGKVLKVIRTTTSSKPNLEFTYDASGNRIAKKVIQPNGDYSTTFYVRDASGNVMAVYKTSGTTNLTLEEQHIYGSSRLGIFKKDKTIKNKARALGERQYELTDHLGNVRVVLIDYYKVGMLIDDRVLSATDYYPFGMVARSRTTKNNYRYGFNTQEKVEELGEGHFTAEYWEYDSRLGRRWNLDPIPQIQRSDYSVLANNPITNVDLLGDKIKYGKNVDPGDNKEIKKQFKSLRRNSETFNQMYKDLKRSKEVYYIQSSKERFEFKIEDGKNMIYINPYTNPAGLKDQRVAFAHELGHAWRYDQKLEPAFKDNPYILGTPEFDVWQFKLQQHQEYEALNIETVINEELNIPSSQRRTAYPPLLDNKASNVFSKRKFLDWSQNVYITIPVNKNAVNWKYKDLKDRKVDMSKINLYEYTDVQEF